MVLYFQTGTFCLIQFDRLLRKKKNRRLFTNAEKIEKIFRKNRTFIIEINRTYFKAKTENSLVLFVNEAEKIKYE